MNQITVIVPGTTANIGVGFDCLGAALTIYNEFQFTLLDSPSELVMTVEGAEASRVSTDKSNLLYQSFLKLYQQIDRTPPGIAIHTKLGVPLARGLGSSATAIVGGLMGANAIVGNPLSIPEITEMAIAIEGHPDNVVPALLGNCQLSVGEAKKWQITEIPWHSDIIPVVAIPDFELSTEEARAVLPNTYSRSDAIFNISRMGLLLRGLATNNNNWLTMALEDKLHQPYREKLICGYTTVKQAALAAGAYGMVISGAGPTLLALCDRYLAEKVVTAMNHTWQDRGISPRVKALTLDSQGAKVSRGTINNQQSTINN
jgi:homoserine kinase